MPIVKKTKRGGDMNRDTAAGVFEDSNGDVILAILFKNCVIEGDDDGGGVASVEFCANGGQSPHTAQALVFLALAMEKDNAERPQNRD